MGAVSAIHFPCISLESWSSMTSSVVTDSMSKSTDFTESRGPAAEVSNGGDKEPRRCRVSLNLRSAGEDKIGIEIGEVIAVLVVAEDE